MLVNYDIHHASRSNTFWVKKIYRNLSGRISEWHPFPGPDPTAAYLGFHLFVALVGVCWHERGAISVTIEFVSFK